MTWNFENYHTPAIITCSWFETALNYKLRILGPKIEEMANYFITAIFILGLCVFRAIYFITVILYLANAILCAIYFITAIDLPDAIFG